MPLLAKTKAELAAHIANIEELSAQGQRITDISDSLHLKAQLILARIGADNAALTGLLVDEHRRANQIAEARVWAAIGDMRLARECLEGR